MTSRGEVHRLSTSRASLRRETKAGRGAWRRLRVGGGWTGVSLAPVRPAFFSPSLRGRALTRMPPLSRRQNAHARVERTGKWSFAAMEPGRVSQLGLARRGARAGQATIKRGGGGGEAGRAFVQVVSRMTSGKGRGLRRKAGPPERLTPPLHARFLREWIAGSLCAPPDQPCLCCLFPHTV